jgi:hypothetical protein
LSSLSEGHAMALGLCGLVQLLVASWLQRGSANSSAITHSLFPFIRLLQRTNLYDN